MDNNENKKSAVDFLNMNFSVVFHNFVNLAKRLFWIVIAATLVSGIVTYLQVDRSFTAFYSVSAVFSVHASYNASTDITSHSDFLDSNAAQMLSETFTYVMQSENAQMLLNMEMGKSVPTSNISAVSTADAGLFTMTVNGSNPQIIYDTLKAAIKIYPQAASTILGDTQIDVINMPLQPPTEPLNTNLALKSALYVAIPVFVVGIVLLFILSMARKTVHSADDLKKLVNLNCLAYIPRIKLKRHSNKQNLSLTITNPRVNSSFNESIRNLRVKMQKKFPKKDGCKILLVTSTLPNEGKTTISTNLALSLCSEGKRVILIDGDLRKQSLKSAIGLEEKSDGLVEILSGKMDNFQLLSVPNSKLRIICGDETTDKPQPLLDSPKMKQLLEMLSDAADFIIIDSAPAGILSDAATTAKYADATLYVVRQDHANANQITSSIQALSANGVELIGCVLNHTQTGTTQYGYGYGYKHSNYYGYGYGYKYAGSYGYSSYNKRRYGGYYGRYGSYGSYGHYGRYSRYEDQDNTAALTDSIAEALAETPLEDDT